ncbi:hypothetical protein BVX95_01385 [archaeon D22]|nr:hypothetical protein BVX95_01385 [archaeon D22]
MKKEEQAIVIENLNLKINNIHILKNINLQIPKGKITALIGPSGSGKTSFMRTIVGFYEGEGKIIINGVSFLKNKKELIRKIGYTTQDGCFYEELTVMENIRYFARLFDVDEETINKRTKNILEVVRLEAHKNSLSKNLSGGMQRRLDLAISIIHKPDILILDEFTTGLDPTLRVEIWDLIYQIKDMGITILFSTHLLDEIEKNCDHIVMIKKGEVALNDSPETLKKKLFAFDEVRIQTNPADYKKMIKTLKKNHGVESYRIEDKTLILNTKKPSLIAAQLSYWLKEHDEELLDIEIRKPTIDNIYNSIY